jgi:hypothetical protein
MGLNQQEVSAQILTEMVCLRAYIITVYNAATGMKREK